MAVFTWRAETGGTGGTGDFAMFSSVFGDGYSQDIPNGKNNEKQKWTVKVSGYASRINEVLTFIREQQGQPFQWKAPNTATIGWYKCKRYSQTPEGGNFWVLTMEFEQAYAP